MNIRNLLLVFLSCLLYSGVAAQDDNWNLNTLHEWSKNKSSDIVEVQLPIFRLEVNQRLKMDERLFSEDQSHYLIIQDDGNLCIYTNEDAFVWCAMSNGQPPGCYLLLQDDGHLCVYNPQDQFVWGSNTYQLESKPTSLYLANDGKLVLLDKNNNSVWASH